MNSKKMFKPRNLWFVLCRFKKAGAHEKTNKALRKAENQKPIEE